MSWVMLMLGVFIGTGIGIFVAAMCRMTVFAKSSRILNDPLIACDPSSAPAIMGKPCDCEHSRTMLADA